MSGCYHAKVTTGLSPGTVTIDKPFATGWLFGLVPPSTVEAASECTNGVARVETKISFVNGLVSAITFNLYTPMHITVTCAASGSASLDGATQEMVVRAEATTDEVVDVFSAASDKAAASGQPVYVRFDQ